MSAIFGIFHRDTRHIELAELEAMQSALAHRGPDGNKLWYEATVGLGHHLLYTTPESKYERQPLVSVAGNLVLCADARIDNRDELIVALGLERQPKREIPDSALILTAYERWGERCPAYILGDFAFALWDGRRQTIFCARDHMGVKPLYYYCSDQIFAFATEIKGLLALPNVPRRINEERLAEHITGGHLDTVSTFYTDIFRLPPAHAFVVTRNATYVNCYWSLDPTVELKLGSDAAYAEAFREIFFAAVSSRLRSSYPAGSMLSGGLDSSSITCAAREILRARGASPLHSFSAIWPSLAEISPASDERRYVQAVVDLGGVKPHYIHGDEIGPLEELERMNWHMDELHYGFNLYMDWSIFKAARQNGVRTLMSGHDGDTTLSYGYEYYADLIRRGRWITLQREAGVAARVNPKRSSRQVIWQFGVTPTIPGSARRLWRWVRRTKPQPPFLSTLLNPRFARHIEMEQRLQARREHKEHEWGSLREEHRQSIMDGLIVHGLETFDKVAAAFQVEPSYPFCDRRLVEFCLALPFAQRIRGGWPRSIMRRGLDGVLPPMVQWRMGKSNIGANFSIRLLHDHGTLLDQVILNEPDVIAPYFNIDSLKNAYRRYAADPLNRDHEAMAVFFAATLDHWLRSTAITV